LYIMMLYVYKSNGGRTTETRHAGKQEDTTPKRGSSLPNYLDQTQTMARKFKYDVNDVENKDTIILARYTDYYGSIINIIKY